MAKAIKSGTKFDLLMRSLIKVPKEEVQAIAAAQSKPGKPGKPKVKKKDGKNR